MGLLFDAGDRELLSLLDSLRDSSRESKALRRSLDPYMHPCGIKELTAPRELRIARAMETLLSSLEEGKARPRLQALRCVRDEALANGQAAFRRNTARVLLQTVKELVRCDTPSRRLELAHEFRVALGGRPRAVRAMLKERKLLEMPEGWSQIAFDDHVHDAHTKGRKTATHLVLDAWIKGMRSMTVIYYGAVQADAARELIEAGQIMEVAVKVGVELPVRLSRRMAHLIWIPRGFGDAAGFLEFLRKSPVERFMAEGGAGSHAASMKVIASLDEFNAGGRLRLAARYGIDLPELSRSDLEAFVAGAPASQAHVAELVHELVLPMLVERAGMLRQEPPSPERDALLKDMDSLDAERISAEFLPASSQFSPEPSWAGPEALLERLRALPSGFRMTLNLSGLDANDALELLWRCKGSVTHLEIFNLKDHLAGEGCSGKGFDELRRALNSGNAIWLKRVVRNAIETSNDAAQRELFNGLLRSLPALAALYKDSHLGVKIGSDSTERSRSLHGMGFALPETLPCGVPVSAPAMPIPISLPVKLRVTESLRDAESKLGRKLLKTLSTMPVLRHLAIRREREFMPAHGQCRFSKAGNVVALGSMMPNAGNGLLEDMGATHRTPVLKNLNSSLLATLKITCGFLPAFLTFLLTKDWWLLAYFGAFIWFGITGVRNVLMSVIGGGGVFRSPLLPWRKLVDWNRLADSLMYTGFSVPLLDLLVKTVFLDDGLGITVSNSPIAVYGAMALANGCYLAAHNMFRGFAAPVVAGNFFRSVLSIPIAWGVNLGLMVILGACSVPDPAGALQKWAAIISKAASDCVAGLIEGAGDRFRNIKLRLGEYSEIRSRLFDLCARIETLFPETDLISLLRDPQGLPARLRERDRIAWRELAVHSLDLLHIYWRKPRAQAALTMTLKSMREDERTLFIEAQLAALAQSEEMEKLIAEGLVAGRKSAPMRLYDGYAKSYAAVLGRLLGAGR